MSKHRRKTRHRQITIAAVMLSALAVPSAAMACLNDQGTKDDESYGRWRNWTNASMEESWKGREWTSQRLAPGSLAATAPASTASTAPKAATSTTPTAPKAPASTAPTAPKAPASTAPTAPKASTTASSGTPGAAAPASGAVARVVALVNSERSKAGCSPVTLNAKLSKAAQDHSADMASHQNMSHTGSDGSDPGTRITRAGYSWSSYGENVAYGYPTPEEVMAGWMSSPGHKRNILDCGFKEIGVGLAQPGSYWTQDFGAAR
ncbi:CAP domain-containing protein [Streptomyces sp. NBC_01384]|uniref:CAP domain-containing protein n=1 Tax=Streptomyces sp. NBC_01384 TaxID=2903847 RepID=UPI00324B827D